MNWWMIWSSMQRRANDRVREIHGGPARGSPISSANSDSLFRAGSVLVVPHQMKHQGLDIRLDLRDIGNEAVMVAGAY